MWVRNVVCSVVTLAALWGLGHYWRQFGLSIGADHDLNSTALFLGLSMVGVLALYLIARAVDARAARPPGGPGTRR